MDFDQKVLVRRCIRNDWSALRQLYNLFGARMFGMCLRYAGTSAEAEELFKIGFARVYQSLCLLRPQDDLDEWVRLEFINAITGFLGPRLKSDQTSRVSFEDATMLISQDEDDALSKLAVREILELISELPPGYRIVLNMFSIEGYSHFEIATKLGICESSSKSQLHRAKNLLRKKLQKKGIFIH